MSSSGSLSNCSSPWRPRVTTVWIPTLLAVSVLTGVVSGPVLRRLPEPLNGSQHDKPLYASLATPRFGVGVAACAFAAALVLLARLPPPSWLVWLPLATVGVLLVGIDAVTTWLPLSLTRVLWLGTLIAAAAQALLAPAPIRAALTLRMLLGAAGVGLFFWTFWRLVGGLGFGDVRLAPVLGAATASVSWSTLAAGLFLGTVLGAVVGIVRHAHGRAGPFPYGPALVSGAFLGLVIVG